MVLTGARLPADATEAASELAGGGLTYAAAQSLATDKEDIVIAAGRVGVTYVVRNTGPDSRTALMAFALPDIDMLALDGAPVDNPAFDAANPANYVGFTVLVDGQPVETFVDSSARALGLVDVTAKLRALKLPLYPLHPQMGRLLAALPDAERAELAALGLVRLSEGQWQPLWRLKTTLFWQQPFALHQSRTMAISYRPIAGTAEWGDDIADELQSRYCVPQGVADDFARRSRDGSDPVVVKWVHFSASAGAGARGPSAIYRTAIATTGATQTAYTCHDGLKSAVPTGSRASQRNNMTADDDVLVLFVE